MPDFIARHVTRREALRALGVATISTLAGCTPARIVLGAYPKEFKRDTGLDDRVLVAFVTTVIPGITADNPDLVRAFGDRRFAFARYRGYFASDLCRRARKRHGGSFQDLELDARTDVIRSALAADGTTRRLYTGAIFLAQVSVYGGIYDDDRGVPFIDYDGRFRPGGRYSYADPQSFLPPAMTADGNPT